MKTITWPDRLHETTTTFLVPDDFDEEADQLAFIHEVDGPEPYLQKLGKIAWVTRLYHESLSRRFATVTTTLPS